MQIEDFKPWHWAVIGLVAGLAFSATALFAGPSFATDDLDTIDASAFEHALMGRLTRPGQQRLVAQYHKDQPLVRDVVVHPPFHGEDGGKYWVTGMLYSVGPRYKNPADTRQGEYLAEQWKPFKYPALAPYHGQNGAVRTFPTVAGYLAAMKGVKGTNFNYRFAWQETPAATWVLPAVAGVLIVGVAWPLALGVMQRWGMARPPKVPAPKPAAPPPVVVSKPVPEVRVVPPPPPRPVPVGPHDDKEYGGEFYPVAKNTHHE